MGTMLTALALALFGAYIPKILISGIVIFSVLCLIVDLCVNFFNWKEKNK